MAIWCYVLSILVMCMSSEARDERPRTRSQEELLQDCMYIFSDGELLRDLQWQANASTAARQEDEIKLIHLGFGAKSWRGVKEPGMATNVTEVFTIEQNAWFETQSLSRTAYRGVYFVNGSLTLQDRLARHDKELLSESMRPIIMTIAFQGVFANLKGHSNFCSRICAGKCIGRPLFGGQSEEYLDDFSITPAQLIYRSANLKTGKFSDDIQQFDDLIHINLMYPTSISITSHFVHGVLKSLRPSQDASYFDPIKIVGIASGKYTYTPKLFEKINRSFDSVEEDISPKTFLKVASSRSLFCSEEPEIWTYPRDLSFSILWNTSCGSTPIIPCSPFSRLNDAVRKGRSLTTTRLQIQNIECTPDWKIRAEFNFWDERLLDTLHPQEVESTPTYLSPEFLLVAEGYWNSSNRGQVVMLAYSFGSEGSPVDHLIQITFQIPLHRTLRHRYSVIGHVRSLREETDTLYFSPISIVGTEELHRPPNGRSGGLVTAELHRISEGGSRLVTPSSRFQLLYRYDLSITERIGSVCGLPALPFSSLYPGIHKDFPHGTKVVDLQFAFEVNSSDPIELSAQLDPFTIYKEFVYDGDSVASPEGFHSLIEIPVSFQAKRLYVEVNGERETLGAAEGLYNRKTGQLCMLGCRQRESLLAEQLAIAYEEYADSKNKSEFETCDVVYSLQYPPTNPELWAKGPFITGNITSLFGPDSSPSAYFQPIFVRSAYRALYASQIKSYILRRNLETVFSLSSHSLTTLFIAIQVGYSNRRSSFEEVQHVSLVMLLVLTLGHSVPILFSLRTVWTTSLPDYISTFAEFSWWESHKIIVRVTNVLTFLLESRFFQLVWRSRLEISSSSRNPGGIRPIARAIVIDYMVLSMGIAFYFHFLTLAMFLPNLSNGFFKVYLWDDVKVVSGLVVDFFLLPQVVANFFKDSEPKVAPLIPLFYIGMTSLRVAPHCFDAWRTLKFSPDEFSSFSYADPNWGLYSNSWNILIPCGSIGLAAVLLLQQRYGGRFCSRKRTNSKKSGFLAAIDPSW